MYQQQNRQNYKISQEIKVKLMIKGILEGKFVTILMSLVTIFALVGVSTTNPFPRHTSPHHTTPKI
jgi:hypothetical protein